MSLFELLKNSHFQNKKVLEKLLAYKLNLKREEIIINYEKEVSSEDFQWIQHSYDQHQIEKKPLEYILGFVEFFGVKFKVNQDTLIPRPETEYMITSVDEYCKKNLIENENNLLLDIGTGSGVLGLSTLLRHPDLFSQTILTDISEGALSVAKQNFESLFSDKKPKVEFLKSNLLEFLTVTLRQAQDDNQEIQNQSKMYDSITLISNLPYIPEQTFENNVEDNVKKREPKFAFVGGEDGCDLYRIMFDQIIQSRDTINRLPKKFTMFLEMMGRQADILRKEYSDKFDLEDLETFHFNIKILKGSLKVNH